MPSHFEVTMTTWHEFTDIPNEMNETSKNRQVNNKQITNETI